MAGMGHYLHLCVVIPSFFNLLWLPSPLNHIPLQQEIVGGYGKPTWLMFTQQ